MYHVKIEAIATATILLHRREGSQSALYNSHYDYRLQRAINAIATSFLQSEGASTSIDGRVTILHDSCFSLTVSSGTDCMITKLIQKAIISRTLCR